MSFKDKMGSKKIVGQRQVNADEALGINFTIPDSATLADIKLSSLSNNPYQPRSTMDETGLEELSESLTSNGLLQPIIVRPHPENPKNFQIIAGHRRTQAAKKLGWPTIRAVIVKDSTDQSLQIDALIENLQRENLNIIDEAKAIDLIVKERKIKQTDVAGMIGKSKGYVSQILKILTLPSSILDDVQGNEVDINLSILTELSYIDNQEIQLKVYDIFKANNLKRADLRDLIASLNVKTTDKAPKNKIPDVKPYQFKQKNGQISIKLDLNNISDKNRVIEDLEKLLETLKK